MGTPPAGTNPPAPGPTAVTEHPVAAPWGTIDKPWNIGEGTAAKPWFETITEPEVRDLMKTKQYSNPHALALAYHNLNKLQVGNPDVIALPAKDATPEQLGQFYTKLGRPASAEAYDIRVAEGVKVDADTLKWGKGLAHKLGLNSTQAQTMVDEWNTYTSGLTTKMTETTQIENATAMTALETRWGPDLAANKAAGLSVLNSLGAEGAAVVQKVEAAIGTASVVELLAMIGKRTKEGGIGPAGGGGGDPNDPSNMTKEAAAARVTALYQDAEFIGKYNDKNHPGNKLAVQQMLALQLKANA